jgi:hypothetical protein
VNKVGLSGRTSVSMRPIIVQLACPDKRPETVKPM